MILIVIRHTKCREMRGYSMTFGDILNLLAIIIVPVVAVLIGQNLQDRAEKRKDKLEIFKTLMIARNGWSPESVRALNIIDIVFCDDKTVIARWKEYYDRLCVEHPTDTELNKIKNSQDKLLEAMAISLGYKDKVTWETIQNPYVPKGMIDAQQMQREYINGQLEMAKLAGFVRNNMGTNSGITFNTSGQDNLKGDSDNG